MERRSFVTTSPSATEALARRMGERLMPGTVVALVGELGSGKTCFTRGLCAGIGVSRQQVRSPSFAFVNEYVGKLVVVHIDLYRIEGVEPALELGVLDYLERASAGVAIIEWADRIAPLASDAWLTVSFSVLASRKREIALSSSAERLRKVICELEP
ncbi:MAG: tRNA (adenosine(37)-N6)-threonylcarbamoyltransferase complex ATPase subunit type 1 TsaE [Chloroflexi bacterium]|nr:MAG: tRNA (adenosine(37)-N6)-threonylcarbamoyltransferase complex ATPase subunit type 1 TsaE [Chloroflexota bacterium]